MDRLDPERVAEFSFDRGPVGCLLTHGFMGVTASLRELGEYLAERDLTVLCRPLPGHSTTAHDMMQTNWHDWHDASVKNLAELSTKCEKVFLCGISMGGTLSLHLAAHYADQHKVAGVAAYAAPIYMKNALFPLLPIVRRFMKFFPVPEKDAADPAARELARSYDRVPLECVSSLLDLIAHVRHDLQDITVPVLMIQSTNDHTVHPDNVRLIQKLLGSTDKTVVEVEKSYHVLTADYDKETVKEKTYEFIRRVAELE
jgi:carboxylesterase